MKKNTWAALLLIAILVCSCTEPYALQTNTFDNVLVVEATITNELKQQHIKLSRTYRLEDEGPTMETGATVTVTDDTGTVYNFIEQAEDYVSENAFQAVPGRQYKLEITTSNGDTYASTTETLTTANIIESVTAAAEVHPQNGNGVQIRVNSFDPTGNSKYYRFEYEETYKIVVPKWSELKATILQDGQPGWSMGDVIVLNPRLGETRVCFSSNRSTDIYLANTTGLSEDRLANFPIRFISDQDPMLINRYSVKVTQYIQNLASYTFYKTLREISGSGGGILSQNQPGFFYGNLRSVTNPTEKIIGFFEVSSVSEKRIFFNFNEIFPNQQPPAYFTDCPVKDYNETVFGPEDNQGANLRSFLSTNTLIYYSNTGPIYSLVKPECGDCTTFSSNVVPAFWEN